MIAEFCRGFVRGGIGALICLLIVLALWAIFAVIWGVAVSDGAWDGDPVAAQNLMKAKDEELQAAKLTHEQYREWAAGQIEQAKAALDEARNAIRDAISRFDAYVGSACVPDKYDAALLRKRLTRINAIESGNKVKP
jgi:hypothetical protein